MEKCDVQPVWLQIQFKQYLKILAVTRFVNLYWNLCTGTFGIILIDTCEFTKMQVRDLQEYIHLNPRPKPDIIYNLFTNTYGQCMYIRL